jgi:hypothetical protein
MKLTNEKERREDRFTTTILIVQRQFRRDTSSYRITWNHRKIRVEENSEEGTEENSGRRQAGRRSVEKRRAEKSRARFQCSRVEKRREEKRRGQRRAGRGGEGQRRIQASICRFLLLA